MKFTAKQAEDILNSGYDGFPRITEGATNLAGAPVGTVLLGAPTYGTRDIRLDGQHGKDSFARFQRDGLAELPGKLSVSMVRDNGMLQRGGVTASSFHGIYGPDAVCDICGESMRKRAGIPALAADGERHVKHAGTRIMSPALGIFNYCHKCLVDHAAVAAYRERVAADETGRYSLLRCMLATDHVDVLGVGETVAQMNTLGFALPHRHRVPRHLAAVKLNRNGNELLIPQYLHWPVIQAVEAVLGETARTEMLRQMTKE